VSSRTGQADSPPEDQVLFVDLGPAESRRDRVITALGRAYSTLDAACIIVDREDAGERVRGTTSIDDGLIEDMPL